AIGDEPERDLQGRTQSQRGPAVLQLAALARGPAAPGRLCSPVFTERADRGKAGRPQARRNQADEGGSGRRREGGRRGQGTLRQNLRGVIERGRGTARTIH